MSTQSASPAWGALAAAAPAPCSLQEVMSEELAQQLNDKEQKKSYVSTGAWHSEVDPTSLLSDDTSTADDLIMAQLLQEQLNAEDAAVGAAGGVIEQEKLDSEQNDLLMAQMLQLEFDREHDALLQREEAKLNGSSKVTLSFTNYRSVHPALEESDDSEDESEYLKEERPEKDTTPQFKKGTGISGKGKNIITKHDSTICGRKNANRVMDRFPPDFETGDGCGIDMKLPNHVYNELKLHSEQVDRRSQRLHEKKEHSTSEMAVDEKTRLILYKLVNNEVLNNVNGIISSGKESVVFHADGGSMTTELIPSECAIKVFKTTLNEFKNRSEYLYGDHRFGKESTDFKRPKSAIVIRMWAQKEEQNLRRLETAGVPCPHVVLLRKHVLVMSFLGHKQKPAPKLKDARLSAVNMQRAYKQTVEILTKMYRDACLIHGDFSEYNLLWHNDMVYVIDVSQAVVKNHVSANEYLLRDCRNVCEFFRSQGVPNVPDKFQLFNTITGLDLHGEEGVFLKKLQDYEKNEDKLRMEIGKEYPFNYFFNDALSERAKAEGKSDRGHDRKEGQKDGRPSKQSPSNSASDKQSRSERECRGEEGTTPT